LVTAGLPVPNPLLLLKLLKAMPYPAERDESLKDSRLDGLALIAE
jgi:hypothetical protein